MTWVMILRLFMLCGFSLTMAACFVRAFRTKEERALVGNIAFGYLAGVLWIAQIPYWNRPLTWLTWVSLGGVVACIAYLITLARKGL